MRSVSITQKRLNQHVEDLLQCRRCPRMKSTPVSGGPIVSRIMLVGQAPGPREPTLKRPFAHTAGKRLFEWFDLYCHFNESEMRCWVYFAAVCRCFPGKTIAGGDRVPAPDEIQNCSDWMNAEVELLKPELVIPVGKLAIGQFIPIKKLDEIIGRVFRVHREHHSFDLIPLPHPSGASPWHKIPPGSDLLRKAMRLIARHPAVRSLSPNGTTNARRLQNKVRR
jgi:uracil-DNA glycosylase